MIKKILIYITFSFTGLIANATINHLTSEHGLSLNGNVLGNGADVVICEDQSSVTLLDVYEGQNHYNIFSRPIDGPWIFELGDESIGFEEKVYFALNKIKKIDTKRFQRYIQWAKDLISSSTFINDGREVSIIDLVDISDSGNLFLSQDCKVKQIAVYNSDYVYSIDKRYWQKLDENNKAALILHGIIYRDFKSHPEMRHQNSIAARYYNSLLITDRINFYTQDDRRYHQLLKGMNYFLK
ncbi:hypothetical protein [Halobacteriovorax sp. RT-2-6]|uniref:hypothetical protein n=1 Tax=unclassified Halobacteriovorax TaxID=2639665 RepID=UPI00399C3114